MHWQHLKPGLYWIMQSSPKKGVEHHAILDVGNRAAHAHGDQRRKLHCGVHVIPDNDLQTECEVMEQHNQQEHYQNGGERFSQPCDSGRGDDD
jgi:hypothetical protein